MLREDLIEAKDGFQIIRSGRQIVGVISPDGSRINIGDRIITKKNCVVDAGLEGEVARLFAPYSYIRTSDVVYIKFNGEEFGWTLKPGEFEVINKATDV